SSARVRNSGASWVIVHAIHTSPRIVSAAAATQSARPGLRLGAWVVGEPAAKRWGPHHKNTSAIGPATIPVGLAAIASRPHASTPKVSGTPAVPRSRALVSESRDSSASIDKIAL